MKSRDIVIGFVFLIILIAGVLWIFKNKNTKKLAIPLQTPNITARINNAFPNLNIPSGVERADLHDINGGENLGVATRTEIVANLPSGQTYQGWVENESGNKIMVGTFRISKSGWLLNYSSDKYPGYNKIIVTGNGSQVLTGSF